MDVALLQSLPAARRGYLPEIAQALREADLTVIVLDDDPTGTQTVYDVPVLTNWGVGEITAELEQGIPLFYILTNSRSLPAEGARDLGLEIGRNIAAASQKTGRRVWTISRSDSTLRGHYPIEVDALEHGLGLEAAVRFIVPAFFEGGRYTVNDIHYVQEGNELVPAAETPFARDHTFGYRHSNLKEWVAEKTGGSVPADRVASFSIAELRTKELRALIDKLNQCNPGTTCIVNAADYADLEVFVLALLRSNIRPLCRTAASIVAVLTGKPRRDLLTREEIVVGDQRQGGLVVVGSYVPKSTRQLTHLLTHRNVAGIELHVRSILEQKEKRGEYLTGFCRRINDALQAGRDVVFYTSRQLISFETEAENVAAAQYISELLSDVVRELEVGPSFIIAKGGITSSDVATRGLGVQRAMIQGQLLPGIPVWKLGPETRFPGRSFVVFPGNVGSDEALTEAIEKLS